MPLPRLGFHVQAAAENLDALPHPQQSEPAAPGGLFWAAATRSPRRRRGPPVPGRRRSGSTRSRRAAPRRAARRWSALPARCESRRWPVRGTAPRTMADDLHLTPVRCWWCSASRAGSPPGRGSRAWSAAARVPGCAPARRLAAAAWRIRPTVAERPAPARPRAACRCRVMVARTWPNSSCSSRARWRRSSSWTSSSRRECVQAIHHLLGALRGGPGLLELTDPPGHPHGHEVGTWLRLLAWASSGGS